MEYIIIDTSSPAEKDFLLDLLKKMKKKTSILSFEEIKDYVFLKAMKESEHSGKGRLNKVKTHLLKLASGK